MINESTPLVVCGTCRRPLARHEFPDDRDQSYWTHELHDQVDQLENGFVHDAVPAEVFSPLDAVGQCDFCSTTPESGVSWLYPCTDFEELDALGVGHRSIGDWAACDPCSQMVERNDYAGLFRATLPTIPEGLSIPAAVMRQAREAAKRWHTSFFAHRSGPRRPLQ